MGLGILAELVLNALPTSQSAQPETLPAWVQPPDNSDVKNSRCTLTLS